MCKGTKRRGHADRHNYSGSSITGYTLGHIQKILGKIKNLGNITLGENKKFYRIHIYN